MTEVEEHVYRHLTTEDIQNIPTLLRDLNVQDIRADPDPDRLTIQEMLVTCSAQGPDHQPRNNEFRYQDNRIRSFRELRVYGHSPFLLAETGLYQTGNGQLMCYQCGQELKLQPNENPLTKHGDIFRSCRHVCRMLGRKVPSSAVRSHMASVVNKVPDIVFHTRRRFFSE